MNLLRDSEYLTAAPTIKELREQEIKMRAWGFKKRYKAHGYSPVTGEVYQWWYRKAGALNQTNALKGESNSCDNRKH